MSARSRLGVAAAKQFSTAAAGFAAALAAVKLTFPSSADSGASSPAAEAPGSSGTSSSSGQDQLVQAQVVFRHGARTPLAKQYWRDLGPVWDVCAPHFAGSVPIDIRTEDGKPRPPNPDDQKQIDDKYAGGCHKGQLTLIGQQQALDFGRYLRWRFSMVHKLLPDTYQEGVVNARTTSYQRTIATLQGVLSGLFPGTQQPITVHTTDEIDEILYTNVKSCKKLHVLLKGLQAELKEKHHPRGEHERVEELQRRVRSALGLPDDHRVHWVDLHDAVTTISTHGKALPAALRDDALLKGVNHMATARFMHVIAPHPDTGKHEEVLRLGMGVLMDLMVQRMEAAAAGRNPATKMFLYSGHDSSVMPLLSALGKHVTDWPPYLSNLILELWRRPSGEHYVKVLYNREPLELTELCGGPTCDLQLFRDKVLGPYLLSRDQHQRDCLVHFMHDQPAGEHVETEEVAVGSSFQDTTSGKGSGAGEAAAAASGGGKGA